MKILMIGGRHKCIFDDDINTNRLTVRVAPDGYKSIVYSSGEYALHNRTLEVTP